MLIPFVCLLFFECPGLFSRLMPKAIEAADVRPLAVTDSPHNMIAMSMLTAALELSFLFYFSLVIADVASLITAQKSLN